MALLLVLFTVITVEGELFYPHTADGGARDLSAHTVHTVLSDPSSSTKVDQTDPRTSKGCLPIPVPM